MSQALTIISTHITDVINAWLAGKQEVSKHTAGTYGEMTADFRRFIQIQGRDMDAPSHEITDMAQAWAAQKNRITGQAISTNTHNLRLTALSSFYEYAIRHEELSGPNPIKEIKRRKRQIYREAKTLVYENEEIDKALATIGDVELSDLRDRALLTLALYTGRRLAEIAVLRCEDIKVQADLISVAWQHTKNGKTTCNALSLKECPAVAYLTQWLKRFYVRVVQQMRSYSLHSRTITMGSP